MPGQKGLNGSPPKKEPSTESQTPPAEGVISDEIVATPSSAAGTTPERQVPGHSDSAPSSVQDLHTGHGVNGEAPGVSDNVDSGVSVVGIDTALSQTHLDGQGQQQTDETEVSPKVDSAQNSGDGSTSDSDDEGWITPSNLKKHQAKDLNGTTEEQDKQTATMQVATLTTDFAMQNVILQINLNLISPSMHRVKHLKTFILRCHACFQTTKEMTKQFCPRCGKPTLTRVACSTSANGEFKLHLKKNMQWNTRGDRYSVPKPVAGSAHGRVQGGGKGGWGNNLILAEDQKEYQRAVSSEKRTKTRDLMDEDYLPGILTGDRGRAGGRIQVGAGRNVNSRKR